jgi:hypothetical protein
MPYVAIFILIGKETWLVVNSSACVIGLVSQTYNRIPHKPLTVVIAMSQNECLTDGKLPFLGAS